MIAVVCFIGCCYTTSSSSCDKDDDMQRYVQVVSILNSNQRYLCTFEVLNDDDDDDSDDRIRVG